MGINRHPTDDWVAQQLREATPFQQEPRYLIRDNDRKYGWHLAAVADGTRIEIHKTPLATLTASPICERFLSSVRRECLDHLLILGEQHLFRAMKQYVAYYNCHRRHQGLAQHIPAEPETLPVPRISGRISAKPILSGLHQHYWKDAAYHCIG
jgi:putative transposase